MRSDQAQVCCSLGSVRFEYQLHFMLQGTELTELEMEDLVFKPGASNASLSQDQKSRLTLRPLVIRLSLILSYTDFKSAKVAMRSGPSVLLAGVCKILMSALFYFSEDWTYGC